MNHSELPKPNMDIFEVESTMKFIAECKSEGVECKELEDYIKPLINSKRVNLGFEKEPWKSRCSMKVGYPED